MKKIKQIYKCNICGNIVELLHVGQGDLVCCGENMELLKTQQQYDEKHSPVIEELPANVCQEKDGFRIKVGELEHPMQEDHYIEWIEINTEDQKSGKIFLNPGDQPRAEFYTRKKIKSLRIYCNIHGLWEKIYE